MPSDGIVSHRTRLYSSGSASPCGSLTGVVGRLRMTPGRVQGFEGFSSVSLNVAGKTSAGIGGVGLKLRPEREGGLSARKQAQRPVSVPALSLNAGNASDLRQPAAQIAADDADSEQRRPAICSTPAASESPASSEQSAAAKAATRACAAAECQGVIGVSRGGVMASAGEHGWSWIESGELGKHTRVVGGGIPGKGQGWSPGSEGERLLSAEAIAGSLTLRASGFSGLLGRRRSGGVD